MCGALLYLIRCRPCGGGVRCPELRGLYRVQYEEERKEGVQGVSVMKLRPFNRPCALGFGSYSKCRP